MSLPKFFASKIPRPASHTPSSPTSFTFRILVVRSRLYKRRPMIPRKQASNTMPCRQLRLLLTSAAAFPLLLPIAFAAADQGSALATTTGWSPSSKSAAAAAAFGLPPGAIHRRPPARVHRRRSSGSSSASAPSSLLRLSASSSSSTAPISFRTISLSKDADGKRSVFKVVVELPRGAGTTASIESSDGGPKLQALLTAEPVLSGPSELVEIKYQVPFELNVEPVNNLALCTKDGPDPTLSEKKGDVLRYASQWTLGLPRQVGLAASAAAFGGALSWQSSVFDVMKAVQWEQVVQALLSNTKDRTDEVILIFERPIDTKESGDGEGSESK